MGSKLHTKYPLCSFALQKCHFDGLESGRHDGVYDAHPLLTAQALHSTAYVHKKKPKNKNPSTIRVSRILQEQTLHFRIFSTP